MANNPYVNKVQTADGTTIMDITGTTAVASDVAQGKYFFTASGQFTLGTNQGGGGGYVTQDQDGYIVLPSTGGGGSPSATQHEIHLEFSDSTDTDIDVYYDDALISTMITAYEPSSWTYSGKTVTLAQLDNVTWYDKQSIPLNTQLIDYTAITSDTAINSSGQAVSQQWYYTSDYTQVDPSMTFTYIANTWFYIGVYDSNKDVLRAIYVYTDGTEVPGGNQTSTGTLSGSKLTGAKYVRLCSNYDNSTGLSLIRTA